MFFVNLFPVTGLLQNLLKTSDNFGGAGGGIERDQWHKLG